MTVVRLISTVAIIYAVEQDVDGVGTRGGQRSHLGPIQSDVNDTTTTEADRGKVIRMVPYVDVSGQLEPCEADGTLWRPMKPVGAM